MVDLHGRQASEDLVAQVGSPVSESGQDGSGGRPLRRGSRLARRRRVLLGVGIAAALLAIGGLIGASFVKSPQQLAADTAAPPPALTMATGGPQDVPSSVQMRGVVYPSSQYDVYASAPESGSAPGTDTGGSSGTAGSAFRAAYCFQRGG